MSDKLRLLICNTCGGTVDELPMYDGPPQYDSWLNAKIAEHTTPSGEPHIGNLAVVDQQNWLRQEYRQAILKEIKTNVGPPGTGEGLGNVFYDTKNNFLEDAMRCWRVEHGRTTDCADYRSDAKKLLPDTRAERKEAGVDVSNRPNTFLCDFCPYHGIVQQRQRKAAGVYN